jgi:hypothetical protein
MKRIFHNGPIPGCSEWERIRSVSNIEFAIPDKKPIKKFVGVLDG